MNLILHCDAVGSSNAITFIQFSLCYKHKIIPAQPICAWSGSDHMISSRIQNVKKELNDLVDKSLLQLKTFLYHSFCIVIVWHCNGEKFRIPSNRVFWIGDRAVLHEICGLKNFNFYNI